MGSFYDHYESELARAIDIYNERKNAAVGEDARGGIVTDTDALRRAFSGADLDLDELMEISNMIGTQGLEAIVRGLPAISVVGGGLGRRPSHRHHARAEPGMKRRWHHFRAWLGGYFWHPCPICGRMFGGHETFNAGGELLDGNGFSSITCPECPGSWARGEDGRTAHRLNVVYSDDPLNPTRVVMGRPK